MVRNIPDLARVNMTTEFLEMIRDLNLDENDEIRKLVDALGLKKFIDQVGRKRLLDKLLQDMTPEEREEFKRQL